MKQVIAVICLLALATISANPNGGGVCPMSAPLSHTPVATNENISDASADVAPVTMPINETPGTPNLSTDNENTVSSLPAPLKSAEVAHEREKKSIEVESGEDKSAGRVKKEINEEPFVCKFENSVPAQMGSQNGLDSKHDDVLAKLRAIEKEKSDRKTLISDLYELEKVITALADEKDDAELEARRAPRVALKATVSHHGTPSKGAEYCPMYKHPSQRLARFTDDEPQHCDVEIQQVDGEFERLTEMDVEHPEDCPLDSEDSDSDYDTASRYIPFV